MKKLNKFLLSAFLATGLLFGCGDVMNVSNENNPDRATVLDGKTATAADMEALSSGTFNIVFKAENGYTGVGMMLAVAADNNTCSHGNSGMWHMSAEPRDLAWDNTPNYTNSVVTLTPYQGFYSAIGAAVDVLRTFENGTLPTAGNERTIAFAKFALGLAYGDLALIYDRAHRFDEVTEVGSLFTDASDYQDLADAALGYFDDAIALTDGSFSIPSAWLGTAADVSGADFKKMVNTSAARLLSYTPRNKTALNAVDWNKVKTYADAGITSDWTIIMDGYDKWYFEAGDYLTFPGWGRTDMRVVHMMEPSLPEHWTDSPTFPHPAEPATSLDARLKTDFQYLASNGFRVARGYYHFSCYRVSRYDDVYTNGIGPKPYIMLAENDMLRAEARAYTGDLAGAAAIINAGTRVTRGQLAPVAANLTAIIDAIHHERHVEMTVTGTGLQFFEMRKLDLLQTGTPLHIPTPGTILQLFGQTSFYTFGTVAKADGTNTSNAGWR
jgi:starch-binding outer membrane protein, SusD/RagB family